MEKWTFLHIFFISFLLFGIAKLSSANNIQKQQFQIRNLLEELDSGEGVNNELKQDKEEYSEDNSDEYIEIEDQGDAVKMKEKSLIDDQGEGEAIGEEEKKAKTEAEVEGDTEEGNSVDEEDEYDEWGDQGEEEIVEEDEDEEDEDEEGEGEGEKAEEEEEEVDSDEKSESQEDKNTLKNEKSSSWSSFFSFFFTTFTCLALTCSGIALFLFFPRLRAMLLRAQDRRAMKKALYP